MPLAGVGVQVPLRTRFALHVCAGHRRGAFHLSPHSGSFDTGVILGSFSAATARVRAAERRRVVEDHARAMARQELDQLFARRDVSLRDRCLWRLLYESGARAQEVLNLNVEDVDLAAKRAVTVRKGATSKCCTSRPAPPACCPRSLTDAPAARCFCQEPSRRGHVHQRLWTAIRPLVRLACPTAGRRRSSPTPPPGEPCTSCDTRPSPTLPRRAYRCPY